MSVGRILVILNNVQLQSTHSIASSYPLPLGRGILVDHWSTISRCYWQVLCILVRLQAWAWYDNTCQIQPVQRDRMPSGPTKYMSVLKCNHFEFKNRRTFECTEQPVITMVALDLAINLGTRSSSKAISCTCCLWLWAEVYWFSMLTLSKWLPASHIGTFFGLRVLNFIQPWISKVQTSVAHYLYLHLYPSDLEQCSIAIHPLSTATHSHWAGVS